MFAWISLVLQMYNNIWPLFFRLSVGSENCMLHYLHVDKYQGVYIKSEVDSGDTDQNVLFNFSLSCSKIKNIFDRYRYKRVCISHIQYSAWSSVSYLGALNWKSYSHNFMKVWGFTVLICILIWFILYSLCQKCTEYGKCSFLGIKHLITEIIVITLWVPTWKIRFNFNYLLFFNLCYFFSEMKPKLTASNNIWSNIMWINILKNVVKKIFIYMYASYMYFISTIYM